MSKPSAPTDTDSTAERILDAAQDLVARYGVRKMSLEDVARAARCSRPTVYRHFSGKDALLGALLLREVGKFLAALDELQAGRRITAGLLEDSFIFTLGYIREHSAAQGLLTVEPEILLPILEGGGGEVVEAIVDAVAQIVRRQIEAGAIRRIDPRIVAESFVRLLISFVVLPKVAFAQDDEPAMRALFREVFLRGITPPRGRR